MQYTTKKCPHCGNTYQFMQAQTQQYGSPLRRCGKCGNNFIDKDYIEIAVSGIRTVDNMKVSPLSIIICIFSIIFSPILAIGVHIALGVIVLLIGIYLPFQEYRDSKNRKEWLQNETKESYKRLSNPQYAQFLLQLGYNVPPEFLNK